MRSGPLIRHAGVVRTIAVLLLSLFAFAVCGGAAQPAPTPSAAQATTATPTPAATATAAAIVAEGGLTFTVSTGSKAVVRVTEQLADRQNLSDAVLTSEKVSGEFTPLPFGTFGMTQPRVFSVLSIKDEIRLEVQLVAKQKA